MKKTLALVLALAMVFSSITVAFAEETIGAEAQFCADLGMLKGETGTVDAAYVATNPTRIQAAIMMLRLKGLEAEALAFTGEDNFADGNIAWAEGANLLAYLKANPQLGWQGDGVNFNPTELVTAQQYYKVLLEALGYKQTVEGVVVGDFTWEEVMTFAADKGLVAPATEGFTVNDLAVATFAALKVNMKDTETTLGASLVEAGKIDEAAAVAAGLVEDKNAAVAVAVDEAIALGNTVVEVEFEEDVDASAAGNVANYSIAGLEVKSVVVTGADTVRLETEAQKAGTIYKLTVGEKTVLFTGIAKVSGGPQIIEAESEDVEEIVLTFDRNLDYATATDIANYTINGVEVVAAEVDADEVTLTTEGLKNKTQYTVKATNMKSIDGVARKTSSETVKSNFDTLAPKISGEVDVQTNQRIVVYFNEEVSKESAEDLANYAITVDEKDGAELEIISVTWDEDDEDNVEIVTEPMEKKEDYKLSVNNIADQRKVANVMTRPSTKRFEGAKEDEDEPELDTAVALSPTMIKVRFTDDSRLDPDSVLDVNNYTVESDGDNVDVESADELVNKNGEFVVLLTVDELVTNRNCKVEVVDILDEFGNALEGYDTFRVGLDQFESVQVTDVRAMGENTLRVYFSDEVNEATVENIANYSLDGGVGAPTKAEWEKTGTPDHTVTLTVNDMVNGYEYELSIEGIEDLAGNVLDLDYVFVADDSRWDNKIELPSADAVNKYVVALSFEEEVEYHETEPVKLVLNGYDENEVLQETIKLTAKAYKEDNTVIEFSDYGNEELNPEYEYTVAGIVYGVAEYVGGITDLIGNVLAIDEDDAITFDGTDDEPDYVEYDGYEQINGGIFEVTMSGNVVLKGGSSVTANSRTFDLDTDDDVVIFKIRVANNKGIVEDTEYTVNLIDLLEDEHGLPVLDDDVDYDDDGNITASETVLTGDETDEDGPVIVNVRALDRYTVEVEFDEDICTVAKDDFKLKNVDTGDNVSIASLDDEDDDDNIVILQLSNANALQGRYEYELTLVGDSHDITDIVDFADNKAEADTFVFDGSNLAQHDEVLH